MSTKTYRRFLLFQAAMALLCILFGIAFPIYMYVKYGFSYGDVYDQAHHVVGHVQYFWFGACFGVLAIGLGAFGFKLAKDNLDFYK
jgi:hypothetical protein